MVSHSILYKLYAIAIYLEHVVLLLEMVLCVCCL